MNPIYQLFEAIFAPIASLVQPNSDVETFDIQSQETIKSAKFVAYILQIGLWLSAAYLAWNCYNQGDEVARIIVTIVATAFSGLYVPFYLIYHVVLGNRC